MKDTEAARRALEVAVQQLGTNPALGERAGPREVAPGSGRGSGRSGLGGAGGDWAMWMHGAHREYIVVSNTKRRSAGSLLEA